jgi:RHS repeat-associated protein
MQGTGGASLPIAVFTPDPVIAGSNGLSATGVPTAAAANSTPLVYYIHADHLNTARVITSNRLNTAAAGTAQNNLRWSWLPTGANPTTVNTSAGDPFGATPANANPSSLAAGNFTFNLRFAGQYFDKESGLHYNHHRDYDPTLGRYVQSDPIGLAGGLNTYLYVGADPNGGVDPEGLQAYMCRQAGLGAWCEPKPPNPITESIKDFWRNYTDMRNVNWKNSDKYFHCKANCEAARRGKVGEIAACLMSDAREGWDQYGPKQDSKEDSNADQAANSLGRAWGRYSNGKCEDICHQYRPPGLPPQY